MRQHHECAFADRAAVLVLIKFRGHGLQLLHPAAQLADLLLGIGQTLLVIISDFLLELVHHSGLIQYHRLGLGPDFRNHDLRQRLLINPVP